MAQTIRLLTRNGMEQELTGVTLISIDGKDFQDILTPVETLDSEFLDQLHARMITLELTLASVYKAIAALQSDVDSRSLQESIPGSPLPPPE